MRNATVQISLRAFKLWRLSMRQNCRFRVMITTLGLGGRGELSGGKSRHFSSIEIKESDGEVVHANVKPKSSSKTKRAKDMARLINAKPWSTEVESSLSFLSPSLSKTTLLQTLQLIKFPDKALNFFNWAQEKMSFIHSDQSYYMMLEILGRHRNLNAARNFLFSIEKRSKGEVKLEDRFFNSLIRSYGRAGLFQESIKVFETMKTVGVLPSVITYNSLLSILLKRGRTSMAQDLYDEMLRTYGVTPDVYTFNTLIRGFCMNSMVDEGFQFFKEMSRFECEPDVITYNTLVDGLCRAGKVTTARNVVKGMCKKSLELNPNVITYTTLIRGYCMKKQIDEALIVFEEMIQRGLTPNDITYNTLIKGLSEAQRLVQVREILEGTAGSGGFTPDTCTFNTLINAHCNAGNMDEALEMFGKMQELNVPADSATYSVLIRTLCQKGDFERAEKLFDELSEKEILLSDIGCTPLVAAYNPMFEYLCGNGKTRKAERVFRQLMKRGIQDPPSYQTLIMGHFLEGTVKDGYELLVLMLRRDYLPDFETYEFLISGLLHKGEPVLAYRTLEKMLKSCHVPKTITFHSVLGELLKKSFSHESAALLALMLERKVRPNINLSTGTVRLLFHSMLRDKAFRLLNLLYESGYSVSMDDLIDYLFQNKRLIDSWKLLIFSLKKHQRVDINMCNTLIKLLCEKQKILEAFDLYYELVEKEMHQQLSCLEELRATLQAGGRKKEAEFVFRRMLIH